MRILSTAGVTLFLFGSLSLLAEGLPPEMSLSEKGVVIDAASAGKFVLPYPGLRLAEKDYTGEKPAVSLEGGTALVSYPSGAEMRVTVSTIDHQATYSFSNVPAEAAGFVFQMQIPLQFNLGGKFVLGSGSPAAFPEQKGKQLIEQGWATSFSLIAPASSGFKMVAPADYQQVQDNRVFGWSVFMYIYNYMFKDQGGKSSFTIRFESADNPESRSSEAPTNFRVDRYGQSARKDFSSKVKSDEELKADVKRQKDALRPLEGPALDSYGGLAGSGERLGLKKTGYFHVEKTGDRQVLVTPEGNAFFQLGVCGINISDDFTLISGREKIYEWLPPKEGDLASAWRPNTPDVVSFYAANWVRKFGRPFSLDEWSGQVVERLRAWGFNSSGAFSSYTDTMRAMHFPYVGSLPDGKAQGARMLPDRVGAAELLDPYAPGAAEALEQAFRERIAPKASDPLLIGYFQGNEQHFEVLPKLIAGYRASKVAAKGKLVELLKAKYKDISKFNAAWNPARPFASFEELKEEPLFIRTDAAAADMREFYRAYLEAYYALTTRTFRKYDQNHILLGSRWTPGTANNKDAVEIGGKYLDVISVNYYTYPVEDGFLKQIHEWSGGRPILLSEWYYAATDQGLGASKEVKDQRERGMAYRNYVEQAVGLPFVVGSEWFIYNDQALTGRFFEGLNGEGNNTGLVNVADRPYDDLVAATRETGQSIYDVMFGRKSAYVFNDPRFTGKGSANKVVAVPQALPGFKLDGTTSLWPGRPAESIEASRLVLGNPNSHLRGDFRLCWDQEALYFLIQVKDATPGMNDRDLRSLWNGDGVELFLGMKDVDQRGSMIFSDRQILLGAGKEPKIYLADHAVDFSQCKLLVVKDVAGDGYVFEIALPWKILGVSPHAGMEFLFDVAIDNSDDGTVRKQQLMWNGTANNPGDRGAWGHARLVEN